MSPRVALIDLSGHVATQPMCDAVHSGLTAKARSLPCRFFYDQGGSELFEQITTLPEYYLTRCEAEILAEYADQIVASMGASFSIVEFGSGSSAKTRYLITAALRKLGTVNYFPIDISREFLMESAGELASSFPELSITAIAAEYSAAIEGLPKTSEARLFVFLGSNIGNFTDEEATDFLTRLGRAMSPNDRLLLGTDLIKDREVLRKAYNDDAGITAKFNLNLLDRINRELGANFSLQGFHHEAPFDEEHSRIEMRLVSDRDQEVHIENLDSTFHFKQGETIHTEWSHKYSTESAAELAKGSGLQIEHEWTDSKGYFAEFLMRKSTP